MSYTEKELIKQLMKSSNIKTAEDTQNIIKRLFGGLIHPILEAEILLIISTINRKEISN